MFSTYHKPLFVLPMSDNYNLKRSRSKMEESFRSMTIEHDMDDEMTDAPPMKRRLKIDNMINNMGKDRMCDDSDDTSLSSNNSNGIDEESKRVMYRLVFGNDRANDKYNIKKNRVDEKIENIIRSSKAMKENLMNPSEQHKVMSTRDDFFLDQELSQLPKMLPQPVRKRSKSFDELELQMDIA